MDKIIDNKIKNEINIQKFPESIENGSISMIIVKPNIEIREKIKEELKNEINKIYFFISEFGFIFILGLILLILYLLPQYHSAKTFTSKKSNALFDIDYTPKIFIHITDIHISVSSDKKLDGSLIFLTTLVEYKPDCFLMTGDLVDNFIHMMGGQNLDEWKIYNNTVRNLLFKYSVIDVSGNHDLWAVEKPTSKSNNFLDYSFMFNRNNIKNEDNFFFKKIQKFGMNFILLNDYRFPVIRPPYGVESHTNKNQLDKLENYINNLKDEECILLSHYQVDRVLLTKSSSGKSYEDIISNKKISFLFTGHLHPKNVQIIHHGSEGGLEFCTPSTFDNKKAGLITIDNDNLIYHEVYIPYLGKKTLFFLTYPVPNEQISSHHIFNLNNFEIRVISYAPDKNIKLKIEGDVNGDLHYVKTLDNGAFLYSYPVNLPNGEYEIHIYDISGYSCNITNKFTIGEKYKGQKEKFAFKTNFHLVARFMLIPFWIFLFIIIIPLFPKLNLKIVKNIEYCLQGKKNRDINIFLFFIYLIIFSPFFFRLRFQETNKFLKYTIFIFFIYPLILPIHFSLNFDGVIGYSFFVFYVTKYNVIYEHWALQMTFIFYVGIIFPFVFFISGKKYYEKGSIIIIRINIVTALVFFTIAFIFNFKAVCQSISLGYLFFTPAYIIIWIILLIFGINLYKEK